VSCYVNCPTSCWCCIIVGILDEVNKGHLTWRPHQSVCPFVTWYYWLNHLSDFCAMQCRNLFYKICPASLSFVINHSVRHKCIATNTFHISWLIGNIQCGRIHIVLFSSCEFVKTGTLKALLHLRAWQNFTHIFLHFWADWANIWYRRGPQKFIEWLWVL
jgi:hypothetical protein